MGALLTISRNVFCILQPRIQIILFSILEMPEKNKLPENVPTNGKDNMARSYMSMCLIYYKHVHLFIYHSFIYIFEIDFEKRKL